MKLISKGAISVKKIIFQFKDCSSAFKYKKPNIINWGGGSYEEFGFPNLQNCQRHLYFFKWCIITIVFVYDKNRWFFVRGGNARWKKLVKKADKKYINDFIKDFERGTFK